jgi:hypothetical protein
MCDMSFSEKAWLRAGRIADAYALLCAAVTGLGMVASAILTWWTDPNTTLFGKVLIALALGFAIAAGALLLIGVAGWAYRRWGPNQPSLPTSAPGGPRSPTQVPTVEPRRPSALVSKTPTSQSPADVRYTREQVEKLVPALHALRGHVVSTLLPNAEAISKAVGQAARDVGMAHFSVPQMQRTKPPITVDDVLRGMFQKTERAVAEIGAAADAATSGVSGMVSGAPFYFKDIEPLFKAAQIDHPLKEARGYVRMAKILMCTPNSPSDLSWALSHFSDASTVASMEAVNRLKALVAEIEAAEQRIKRGAIQ